MESRAGRGGGSSNLAGGGCRAVCQNETCFFESNRPILSSRSSLVSSRSAHGRSPPPKRKAPRRARPLSSRYRLYISLHACAASAQPGCTCSRATPSLAVQRAAAGGPLSSMCVAVPPRTSASSPACSRTDTQETSQAHEESPTSGARLPPSQHCQGASARVGQELNHLPSTRRRGCTDFAPGVRHASGAAVAMEGVQSAREGCRRLLAAGCIPSAICATMSSVDRKSSIAFGVSPSCGESCDAKFLSSCGVSK